MSLSLLISFDYQEILYLESSFHLFIGKEMGVDRIYIIFWIIGIIVTLIAAFGGSYFGAEKASSGAFENWQKQEALQNKNMALALKNEIQNQANYVNKNAKIISQQVDNKLDYSSVSPLYPDTGLYYVFQKDISNLDSELSFKLYNYYQNLILAEHYREEIYETTEYIRENKNNPDMIDKINTSQALAVGETYLMSDAINTAVKISDTIIKQIEEKYGI